ncbi:MULTISPECIES: ThiF family adenylyltransferase [Bacillus]|uniref:ThiF family adenylyltransferase n=1 Tax=Bacillus TaxID=1386 RepID=UPI000F6CB6F4|nr:hypothetical protein CT694_31425 [Bacillus wiedmannii bv. thuringiensis]
MKKQIEFPIVSSSIEPIKLSNGDIFLNSHMGRHMRIEKAESILECLLEKCDGTKNIKQIVNELRLENYDITEVEIEEILETFSENGIVVECNKRKVPEWLSNEQYDRYFTLIDLFENFPDLKNNPWEAFEKIRNAKVGIIGMGGTGSLLAMMLGATGVGYLKLMDGDQIESSNLVRQIFYDENQIGEYKAEIIKKRINSFNRDVNVECINSYVENLEDVYSFADGLDFIFVEADEPRFILNRWVNEACIKLKIPYIGSFAQQIGPLFIPEETACFTCYEEYIRQNLDKSDYEDLIIGMQKKRGRKYPSVVSGITLSSHYQFLEWFSWLTGTYEPLTKNKVLTFKTGDIVRTEDVLKNELCESCSI